MGRSGPAVSGFLSRLGLQLVGALPAAGGRSDSATGGRVDSCAQHVAHGSPGTLGPTAFRAKFRRQGVFLQLGRGGKRGGDQTGSAARDGQPLQDHHVSWRLSWPNLRGDQRDGPAEIPRRHRAATAGFRIRAIRRLGCRQATNRSRDMCHPDRAGARRGRHSHSACRLFAGLARVGRRARAAVDLRRSAKRMRPNGQVVCVSTLRMLCPMS